MLRPFIVAGLLAASDATAAPLDTTDADDVFRMNTGTVYSRIRGEKDRHLFNVAAMNIRQCQPFSDPVRGVGSRSVSREVMFYLDPETNALLKTWTNPWTGEEVEITHVQNDPVNAREPTWSRDKDGNPVSTFTMHVVDGYAYQGGGAALLFYDNPLAGDYQDYVGNKYQAAEFLTAAVPMADLTDPKATRVRDSVISWGRISRWMPWMKMGGRDGLLVHYTGGLRLNSWDELPGWMKAEIRANYPAYVAPPPVDDRRPNETSWTVMKRKIDAQRAGEAN
jgi:hypothetical protein